MIWVTRLNGKRFVVNCEIIKFVEAIPDTLITLTTGDKIMIKEPVDHVIQETLHYRQRIAQEPPPKESKESG